MGGRGNSGDRNSRVTTHQTFDDFYKDFIKDEDIWNMSLDQVNGLKRQARELWNRRNVDFQGYTDVTYELQMLYRGSVDALKDAGFKAINDFSLSSLVREGNVIASDNQPWNNKVVYLIWDSDFKRWEKAAERRY